MQLVGVCFMSFRLTPLLTADLGFLAKLSFRTSLYSYLAGPLHSAPLTAWRTRCCSAVGGVRGFTDAHAAGTSAGGAEKTARVPALRCV
jgi:hypothetical protein